MSFNTKNTDVGDLSDAVGKANTKVSEGVIALKVLTDLKAIQDAEFARRTTQNSLYDAAAKQAVIDLKSYNDALKIKT